MNKAFLKAINDIKKQTVDTKSKQQSQIHYNKNDDLSSDEEKKLKKMGVIKKIKKAENKYDTKWKHDRYKQKKIHEQIINSKTNQNYQYRINYTNSSYQQIYPLVKNHRIFIAEIDDKHIVLTKEHIYEQCKKIFEREGIVYSLKSNQIQNTNAKIFERFK